uniref:Uncharacterized protein n=1 Tax=Micrurus carvalhoi TaxID=3147026 RepID=A0A2H6NG94_9SAUR
MSGVGSPLTYKVPLCKKLFTTRASNHVSGFPVLHSPFSSTAHAHTRRIVTERTSSSNPIASNVALGYYCSHNSLLSPQCHGAFVQCTTHAPSCGCGLVLQVGSGWFKTTDTARISVMPTPY